MNTNPRLKAYVKYDKNGHIVPFSMQLRKSAPKNGVWREVAKDLCCFPTTTTTEEA